jgi:hypothetical protein
LDAHRRKRDDFFFLVVIIISGFPEKVFYCLNLIKWFCEKIMAFFLVFTGNERQLSQSKIEMIRINKSGDYGIVFLVIKFQIETFFLKKMEYGSDEGSEVNQN